MTEIPPDVPPGYQPPPVYAYQPPPPRNDRRNLGLIILVAVLGLLVVAGGALVVLRAAPADEPAAQPVAAAPAGDPVGAAPTGAADWPELEVHPAGAELILQGHAQNTATWIHFTNETAGTVVVKWVGYDQQRIFYQELAPGESYDQPTYLGHVWIVTRPDGTPFAVFEATGEPSRATIR
ncbi:hypothetical protein GCM10010168_76650 [Actinoplanes ianthinogenes]|uniref:von Hippel-Lindau disease tumour suppressor beta domain-containing protein n=1 Tax=Actinoplanes ianthinogenes TaxID=122358 RepID=A0ABM7M9V7_9ACTN|nr:hypothetical protein [Actinoplanes ianthinogenes]BCJ48409.1 hypothetical protein Aiant_90660 [Actinoplanes ianthinogenes]GGR46589.1 hypothetical protein GCM10010168_76650 [Actinoplanes ianthinogenes]